MGESKPAHALDEVTRLSAGEAVRRLMRRDLSPLDLVEAAARRIAEIDGSLNALPTLALERARAHAKRLMSGKRATPLAGLPIVIKDLNDVAGVRTTYGSPIFADHVPERSDIVVETLERNGAVVLAKSNTPEFAAGANTFNPVFGKTRNPWNRLLTCGGSSGGSAVALATGMAWLATGSDLGGSLRTPASFCSVVGLRPSPGRVAHGPFAGPPYGLAFDDLFVDGPMARTVADVALMLDAMVGEDPRDPLSLPAPKAGFLEWANRPQVPRQIAWSPDLAITPVDPEVAEICRSAARRLERLGAAVEQTAPDLTHASEIFQTLRAKLFAGELGPLVQRHREQVKPDVIWNVEKGMQLTGAEIARAERLRAELYAGVVAFFRRFDLLVCPAAIVPPFPVDQRYVTEVAGHRFDNYVDWISITYAITLTACPALSLPCGFTRSGLPVGLQMIGRPRGEGPLLAAAAALEAELGLANRVPIDPMGEIYSGDSTQSR